MTFTLLAFILFPLLLLLLGCGPFLLSLSLPFDVLYLVVKVIFCDHSLIVTFLPFGRQPIVIFGLLVYSGKLLFVAIKLHGSGNLLWRGTTTTTWNSCFISLDSLIVFAYRSWHKIWKFFSSWCLCCNFSMLKWLHLLKLLRSLGLGARALLIFVKLLTTLLHDR